MGPKVTRIQEIKVWVKWTINAGTNQSTSFTNNQHRKVLKARILVYNWRQFLV
jgi:hypothetical protein